MLLRIGDLWSEQRFVASPEHEVATFNNLRIDRTTTQLLKVGHSDEQGNFLLPAIEHPWHMANTHSYCVRVDLGDCRSLVVPSMELARFYFGSSRRLSDFGAFPWRRIAGTMEGWQPNVPHDEPLRRC